MLIYVVPGVGKDARIWFQNVQAEVRKMCLVGIEATGFLVKALVRENSKRRAVLLEAKNSS